MLAIVAPGQGAQTPGFLAPWLELPTFATRLAWLSAVSGLDLAHYGTEADAETIRDTAVAQPLLVAAGLTAVLELLPSPSEAFRKVGVVAGHSVGEITAAAGTNVISVEAAMVLVRERGKAMAAASAAWPTSMSAIIGGDRDEVMAAIQKYGLTVANDNGSGQVVAGGTAEQLAELAANPPHRTRIVPLSVAGAFHTVHMEPAVSQMQSLVKAVSTKDPRSVRTTPACRCSRTPTARWSRAARSTSSGSSVRSRPPSAGTSAWPRWPSSESPVCSSYRRREP